MVPIWYASMTEVQRAADLPSSLFFDTRLQQVMNQATDAVKELCHRDFEPTVDTRWFRWPQDVAQDPGLLMLGRNELISVTSIVNGDGSTVDLSDCKLIKVGTGDDGPPYSAIEYTGGWTQNADFSGRSIGVTGVYGFKNDETSITTTASNLTGTTVDVADSSGLGVGSLIRIATERLVIRRRGWLTSSNAVAINLPAEESSSSFTVTSGAAFNIGEWLLLGAEQMEVVDIVGNTLFVQRAINGSGLQVHTAVTTVYVNRRLTVHRGVLGTSSVDTASGASVYLFQWPGLVNQQCKAEALQIIQQDAASYGSRSGSGQGEMPMAVRGIPELRNRVMGRYGRFRSGVI